MTATRFVVGLIALNLFLIVADAQAAGAWQHTCRLEGQTTLAFKSQRLRSDDVRVSVFVNHKPLLQTFETIFGRSGLVVRGQGVTVTFIQATPRRLRVEVANFRHKRVKVVIRIYSEPTKPKKPSPEDKEAAAMSSAVVARP